MTGEVVNLNRARKARTKAAKAAGAAENRARFGRTRAEKAVQTSEEARRRAELDGAKRET